MALALALAPILALAACDGDDGGGDEGSAGPSATPVEVAVARRDTVTVDARAVGSLEARALVTVRAETAGRVASVPVREGSRVERGALLLQLDTAKVAAEARSARGAVERARAERDNLARQVERNRELLDEGAISQQSFDDLTSRAEAAAAGVTEAEGRLDLARERLSDASVRAPFAGALGERYVDPGAYLDPGAPLFDLVDDDPLEIAFEVPESYVGELEAGRTVQLQVRSRPGEVFTGEVDFVSPVVDPGNRTVRVKAVVANPEAELRPGQFADVRLAVGRRSDAVLVPEAAVVPGREQDAVFRFSGGEVERVVVETGARAPGRVELRQGIAPGDTVVVAGQQRLQDGAAARIADGAGEG